LSQRFGFKGKFPNVSDDCFIAPGVCLVGDVMISEGSAVWYNSVLRGDVNYIRIGKYSNIQDGTIVHANSGRGSGLPNGLPTIVGDYVSVGHNCVLHACTIEDACLIGMSAVVMDGAVIGKGSIVGAGTVVTKGTIIPPLSVVIGIPSKVIKTLPEESLKERIEHAKHYYRLAMENKQSLGL